MKKNGRVFDLIGICSRALKKASIAVKSAEMIDRINNEAKSYYDALTIMSEYCEIN